MRLGTWNCHGGLSRRWKVIETLDVDVLAVQECGPDTPQQLEARNGWTGAWQRGRYEKGVAVLVRAPCEVDSIERSEPCALTVVIKGPGAERFRFVGFWAMTPARADDTYPQQAEDLLRTLPDDGMPTVVAGDFNASWRNKHHLRNVHTLSERGLVNAYNSFHQVSDDVKPPHPTSYFRRSESRPYHMDFVFVPRVWSIKDVQVGSFADYTAQRLSDHVPVVVSAAPGGGS